MSLDADPAETRLREAVELAVRLEIPVDRASHWLYLRHLRLAGAFGEEEQSWMLPPPVALIPLGWLTR